MSDADQQRRMVLDALDRLVDPASRHGLVAAGLLESLDISDGIARAILLVRQGTGAAMETVALQAEAAMAAIAGIRTAQVILTAHRTAPAPPPTPPAAAGPAARPKLLADIPRIVAIASGKGGVGKSTTAVNLAVAMAARGLRVGLLDADIHGPSLPTMLGLRARPAVHGDRIQPLDAWGLKAISIGLMVDPRAAMIWRGPMVMGALEQLMGQVDWGSLDVMVIDLPPGTGDAQLTLTQRLNLSGAVIVSTPQDVALDDARRGVAMFEKVGVRVLGLIENMSYFCCPACNARTEIFGHGGARGEAAQLHVPFLGEIPLLAALRASADAGQPIVASLPNSEAAQCYRAIAERICERLAIAPGAATLS